jgi:hypothetical protein
MNFPVVDNISSSSWEASSFSQRLLSKSKKSSKESQEVSKKNLLDLHKEPSPESRIKGE